MSNITQLGRTVSLDPKTMLIDILENAEQYEDVLVVIRKKDESCEKWCTSSKPWLLFGFAGIIQDLALNALRGNIVNEDRTK